MEYRVSEIAEAAGVAVDTVRFYQGRGLLPAPERRGRFAIYTDRHLERLRRIRTLLEAGFSLAQIRKLLEESTDPPGSAGPDRSAPPRTERTLLDALAASSVGEGTVSRRELAERTGVPPALVSAAVQAGLLSPIEIRGEERFPRSDLEMVVAALDILDMGLPLDRLLELAALHAGNVDRLAERAIDLFDDFVRKPAEGDEDAVRRIFERLLPRVTQIVALHFQRTIVTRALARLRGRGDDEALEAALELTRSAHLEVQWR